MTSELKNHAQTEKPNLMCITNCMTNTKPKAKL